MILAETELCCKFTQPMVKALVKLFVTGLVSVHDLTYGKWNTSLEGGQRRARSDPFSAFDHHMASSCKELMGSDTRCSKGKAARHGHTRLWHE